VKEVTSKSEGSDYQDIIPPLNEEPPTHTDDESAEAEQIEMIEKPEVAYDELVEAPQNKEIEEKEASPEEDPSRKKLR